MSGTFLHPEPFGARSEKKPGFVLGLVAKWRAATNWTEERVYWAAALRAIWNQNEWDADFEAIARKKGLKWAMELVSERIEECEVRLSGATHAHWTEADAIEARSELCDCRRVAIHLQWANLHSTELEKMRASLRRDYLNCVDETKAHIAATNPMVLKTTYNAGLFLADECFEMEAAIDILKQSFDYAIQNLDTLEDCSYKDATLIMQLQRDAITLYVSDEFHVNTEAIGGVKARTMADVNTVCSYWLRQSKVAHWVLEIEQYIADYCVSNPFSLGILNFAHYPWTLFQFNEGLKDIGEEDVAKGTVASDSEEKLPEYSPPKEMQVDEDLEIRSEDTGSKEPHSSQSTDSSRKRCCLLM